MLSSIKYDPPKKMFYVDKLKDNKRYICYCFDVIETRGSWAVVRHGDGSIEKNRGLGLCSETMLKAWQTAAWRIAIDCAKPDMPIIPGLNQLAYLLGGMWEDAVAMGRTLESVNPTQKRKTG